MPNSQTKMPNRRGSIASLPPPAPAVTTRRPLGMSSTRRHGRHGYKRHHCHYTSTSASSSSSDSRNSSRKSNKNKSGAFRKYSDHVRFTFKWPNEYIGREDGQSPTYNDMTFTELIFGLMSGLLDQLPRINRNRFVNDQLHYLREIFRVSTTCSLANTKNCHRRVLEALEKGEISPHRWTEWNNRRRQALDRIHRTSGNPAKNNNKKPGAAATTPNGKSSK